LQVISEIQKNAFYDLAGGLLFANTTAADVQQAKDNKAEQDAAEQAENQRLENEIALRDKWSEALANTNADEAFYNGDEAALVIAINAAVATMG